MRFLGRHGPPARAGLARRAQRRVRRRGGMRPLVILPRPSGALRGARSSRERRACRKCYHGLGASCGPAGPRRHARRRCTPSRRRLLPAHLHVPGRGALSSRHACCARRAIQAGLGGPERGGGGRARAAEGLRSCRRAARATPRAARAARGVGDGRVVERGGGYANASLVGRNGALGGGILASYFLPPPTFLVSQKVEAGKEGPSLLSMCVCVSSA